MIIRPNTANTVSDVKQCQNKYTKKGTINMAPLLFIDLPNQSVGSTKTY